jgi:hypothetical protein
MQRQINKAIEEDYLYEKNNIVRPNTSIDVVKIMSQGT